MGGLPSEFGEVFSDSLSNSVLSGSFFRHPRFLACPLPHRVVALQSLVQEITAHWFSPAKTWQVFLGHLASFTDLIPLCRLFMRPLQRHFLKFFSLHKDIPSRPVPLSPQIKSLCLLWGFQEFLLQGKSFSPPPRLLISSDASNQDWGAFLHPYHVSGIWSQESCLHINSLELLASLSGPSELRRSGLRSIHPDSIRQLHGGLLHQPSGRDSLPFPLPSHVRPEGLVSGERYSPLSLSCPRGRQPAGGLPLQGEVPAFRVESESLGFSEDFV